MPGQVGRDQGLFAVLPAPDVEQVVGGRIDRLPWADPADLQVDSAPSGPACQDCHVSAVGVDVQVVRIEMSDDDLHAAASQYGRTRPRSPMIFLKASMAV